MATGIEEFLAKESALFGFQYGIQSIPDVAELYDAGGDTYASSLLTGEEYGQFRQFRGWKRKVEWLAGRIAVKAAFGRYSAHAGNALPRLPVSVLNNEAHVPYFPGHPEVHLSITHSHGYAVAVVAPFDIGIDLEKIEERPLALTHYFFSEEEQNLAAAREEDSGARDGMITHIWSRKEAVSKFLQLGGNLDFKDLKVLDDEVAVKMSRETIRLLSAERDGYCISLAMSLNVLAA
ncbi:MAG: 4'-phosphopantetheinyl transferase superfamily protein [Bacteroidota bacterium]